MQPGEQKGVAAPSVAESEPQPSGSGGSIRSLTIAARKGLKSFGWPLLCLFQLGLIAGAFQFGSRLAGPQPQTKSEEASTKDKGDAVPVLGASERHSGTPPRRCTAARPKANWMKWTASSASAVTNLL